MHVQIRLGLLSIRTTVSILANESDAQSILHGQVSLTTVNDIHMYVFHEFLFNHFQNLLYLKPKATLHCYYIYHFWVLVSGILNVFNSYKTSINYSYGS